MANGINQFTPGCCGCGAQQCCTWFCNNQGQVPTSIDVTDPVYGTFTLPLVNNIGTCSYQLDTHLAFAGLGSCPSAMVPVHMSFGKDPANGSPAFFLGFNDLRTTTPTTGCVRSGVTNNLPCPGNVTTFPATGGSATACFITVPVDFVCSGTMPWTFSGHGSIALLCGGTDPNGIYLLYGACPATGGSVAPTWNFSATSFQPAGCTCCSLPCGTCTLPKKDLQLIATNTLTGNETLNLAYTPSTTSWVTETCDTNGVMFTMSCSGSAVNFLATYWTVGACPGPGGTTATCSTIGTAPHALTQTAISCVTPPFSMTVSTSSSSCPALDTLGYTQFEITDTSPIPAPPMCQKFCVTSCNLSLTGASTITVSVYDHSGGTLQASGDISTLPGGNQDCVWLSWTGSPGSYFVTATSPNGGCTSSTLTLACGATTNLGTLSYACVCGGSLPGSVTVTIVYTFNGGVSNTCSFTLTQTTAGVDNYIGTSCGSGHPGTGPVSFSLGLVLASCELWVGGFTSPCVTPFGHGSCNPLNMIFPINIPGNCALYPGDTIIGNATITP